MTNLFKYIVVVLFTLTLVGCAGMGKGKSKVSFTDKSGNPVVFEHEVEGPPEKKEPK